MLTVAIVGKPNVGKSTLFNRIIQKRKSIVHDSAGVTRDRIYEEAEWLTRKFNIIDTGGFSSDKNNFQENINQQVAIAIEEAQVIVFVVSYLDGIDQNDVLISKKIKKYAKNKKIIFVVNKAESNKVLDSENKFFNLGFGKPIYISSAHGTGVGDLLDEIIKETNNKIYEEKFDLALRFCIIGRPNVGKSSLVNTILNENKVIVSEIPGSTRDSTDNLFKYNHKNYIITDTAGIRRKGKVSEPIEKISVLRAEAAIKKSQLILFMLDASEPFNEQDEVIGGLAYKANIPTIIVVNKWDAIFEKDTNTMNRFKKEIEAKFQYLNWAPIVFISANENKRIHTIFETIEIINQQLKKKISTSILNEVVLKAQMMQQAPLFKGNRIIISYITQIKSQIPSFVIFCNSPKHLHFSYARYIENKIRIAFGLNYVPITLFWKDKNIKSRGISIDE